MPLVIYCDGKSAVLRLACDACGRPITSAADAAVWFDGVQAAEQGTAAAMFSHKGDCAAACERRVGGPRADDYELDGWLARLAKSIESPAVWRDLA